MEDEIYRRYTDGGMRWVRENNLHTLPTEAEIAERCAEARAKWNDATWAKYQPRPYEIPEVVPYAILD